VLFDGVDGESVAQQIDFKVPIPFKQPGDGPTKSGLFDEILIEEQAESSLESHEEWMVLR
jgi:hypothetical protein